MVSLNLHLDRYREIAETLARHGLGVLLRPAGELEEERLQGGPHGRELVGHDLDLLAARALRHARAQALGHQCGGLAWRATAQVGVLAEATELVAEAVAAAVKGS